MNSTLMLSNSPAGALFSHMAFYGLGAILADSGAGFDLRLHWSGGPDPRPVLDLGDASVEQAASVVRDHAAARALPESWVQQTMTTSNASFGLFSPRVKVPASREDWLDLAHARRRSLDLLVTERSGLDLRMIGALGEPGYWRESTSHEPRPDEAATRFEMQPRNAGSEFIRNRLAPLARAVGARTVDAVLDGLTGLRCDDEIGKNKATSRTATGFTHPGPVDNALAWCAMWGISMFPVALRVTARDISSGSLGRRPECFYVPVWSIPLRIARLRTILISQSLRAAAADTRDSAVETLGQFVTDADWQELGGRGVRAVIRFPVAVYGSASAPERRALEGVIIRPPGGS